MLTRVPKKVCEDSLFPFEAAYKAKANLTVTCEIVKEGILIREITKEDAVIYGMNDYYEARGLMNPKELLANRPRGKTF